MLSMLKTIPQDEASLLGAITAENSRYDSGRYSRALPEVSSTAVVAALALSLYGANPARDVFEQANWSSDSRCGYELKSFKGGADERNAGLSTEVTAYRNLRDGWDGPDSVAPAKNAIDDALAMIDKLPVGAKLPTPMAAADGEVGFYWKSSDSYIDVGFKGDGRISYYGRAGGVAAKDIATYDRDEPLPAELLKLIQAA